MYLFCFGNNPVLSEWELKSVLPRDGFSSHALGLSLPDKACEGEDFAQLQKKLGGIREIVWFHDYVFSSWEQAKLILQGWLKELPGREMTLVADHLPDQERKKMLDDVKTIMERKVRYRLDKRYLLQEKGIVFWWWEEQPGKYFFGMSVSQQDIDEYSQRDYGKPSRSMLRGMLPPKLAQIMINVAAGPENGVLWDPFCGTGTILIEAALMGKKCIGSDKDLAAIKATEENVQSLLDTTNKPLVDAVWQQDITMPWTEQMKGASYIVAEGYLGQPQSKKVASPADLRGFWQQVEPMYQKFFTRLSSSSIHTMVLATPVVGTEAGLSRLAIRTWNILFQAGWEKEFQADYMRPNQIVGREITKLRKS